MSTPAEIRFAADRMLGRLARLLRLLGYDTVYARDLTPQQLEELARPEGRVILTCGRIERRFSNPAGIVALTAYDTSQQLREIVERLKLDTHSGFLTRCTLCNTLLSPVEKEQVRKEVPPRAFEAYAEFFRCAGCGQVYWRGSHVERMEKKLVEILGAIDAP